MDRTHSAGRASPQDDSSDNARSTTPPGPLLRPAQGAWASYKPRPVSPSTTAPPKRPYVDPQAPRMTHPESAQRHSQATSHDHRDYYRQPRQNTSAPRQPSAYTHYRSARPDGGYTPVSVSASASTSAPRNPPPPAPSMYPYDHHHTQQQHQQQHPEQHTETIVLLMEDVRHGSANPDFQLAEVSVTLRDAATGGPSSDANVGWWADGEEVIRALQTTPSRLEGAAKVFARRGKYRQCFVRFSEDGTMECQPSTLQVSRERAIELIIEPNLEPRPPYTPQDPYARNYSSASTPRYDDYHYPISPYAASSQHPYYSQPPTLPSSSNNGKRTSAEIVINPLNPGGDDHLAKRPRTSGGTTSSGSPLSGGTPGGGGGGVVSPNVQMKRPVVRPQLGQPPGTGMPPRPSTAPQMPRPGSSGSAVGPPLLGQPHVGSGSLVSPSEDNLEHATAAYPFIRQDPGVALGPSTSTFVTSVLPSTAGPGGKAPKEVVNASIVAYLRAHIQTEDGYMEFAASKGRLLPIPDLLKGYRFATRIVNAWANRKTPVNAEGCPNKRITKNHVLQALFRQTSWGSDCEQTLQLADRYGRGGPREDARVVEILSGGTMLPEKSGDPKNPGQVGRSQGSVALLDFLKDVDREHKARMEEEARRSAALEAASGVEGEGKEENEQAPHSTTQKADGGAGE